MTSSNPSSRTRRWVAVLGLLVVAVIAGWLLSSREEAVAEGPVPQPRQRGPASPERAPDWSEATAASGAPAPRDAPPQPAAPIVDEIVVEKQEVCSGEENLISVRAHTPDGKDAYLHYTVGGGTGQRVPVRVWLEEDGSYQLPTVTVFTQNNVAVTVPVPHYKVKQCEPERLVHVLSRRLPNAEDDFEFFAKVVERPTPPGQPAPKPFAPVKYVWSFDDEPPVTSPGPIVSHTLLSNTGATDMYTQHLIRVDVFDAAGRKETGRSSLQVLNTSFENFDKKGVVTVLAVGTPRFPALDEDGVVRQTFRLYHRFRGPVRIERVSAIRAFQPPVDGPPPPEQVDAATLPVTEVPEGRGTEVRVSLDTSAEPDVVSLTYALEGTSADGHRARGTFSIMRPPPRPTKENSAQVTDPVLLAKIKRARELLNQPYVTDEDLWRLEREGRLADLKVEPASPASAPPPDAASGRSRTR
jgi:hypothetical protein